MEIIDKEISLNEKLHKHFTGRVKRWGSGLNYLLTNNMITLVIEMARKLRIHYPRALYHVIVLLNNGLNKEIHNNPVKRWGSGLNYLLTII